MIAERTGKDMLLGLQMGDKMNEKKELNCV